MPTRRELEIHYNRYSSRAPSKPIGNKGTTEERLIQRSRYAERLALEIINKKVPLIDPKGYPTVAAMELKRWSYPLPSTLMDVRQILIGIRQVLSERSTNG